ncbi:MAG TPA: hypothetical protein VIK52_10880 [Opitutaceae bacterium]
MVDFSNIVLELQTVAVLYGEMARLSVAAKHDKEQAEMRLRMWKTRVVKEAQEQAKSEPAAEEPAEADEPAGKGKGKAKAPKAPKADKGLSEHAKQDAYRAHPEYEAMYRPVQYADSLVSLAEDLKTAFEIKGRALGHLAQIDFGHTRVAANDDRLAEMSKSLEAEAIPLMEDAAAAAESMRSKGRQSRPLPASEETK